MLYNAPRQATIRSNTAAILYSLDRETYRFIVAQSSNNRTQEIKKALGNVDLLKDLTEDQLNKIADAVELFPYNTGDLYSDSVLS